MERSSKITIGSLIYVLGSIFKWKEHIQVRFVELWSGTVGNIFVGKVAIRWKYQSAGNRPY